MCVVCAVRVVALFFTKENGRVMLELTKHLPEGFNESIVKCCSMCKNFRECKVGFLAEFLAACTNLSTVSTQTSPSSSIRSNNLTAEVIKKIPPQSEAGPHV